MKCPGQDTRFWTPKDVSEVACGRCGESLEFFKDEGTRRCPACGKRVVNPKVSIGCAQWCAHAKECLGYDPQEGRPEEGSPASLADQLIESMKREFGTDQKRIAHALAVLDYAERLLCTEEAEPRVVVAAAVLHDIGIQEAERKHGSAAGKYQELEGPPIAERILRSLGFAESAIQHVCEIVAHHHSGGFDSGEFRILWDADTLVNARDEPSDEDPEQVRDRVLEILQTESGKLLAAKVFRVMPEGSSPAQPEGAPEPEASTGA